MFWAPVGPWISTMPRTVTTSVSRWPLKVGTIRCHLNLQDLCILNSLSEADPRAPKRSKKPSAFNPTVPSQTGPKGPEGALGPWPLALWSLGPLVPWPFGPLALWSRRALVLSSKHGATSRRSESTTERQYDGASLLGRRAARSVYEFWAHISGSAHGGRMTRMAHVGVS